ncbi:DUF6804 family protein [Pedobacter boryungensis]|uniref:DUF6804 family protein n=1 Tax=Pedobacter boryungensis TaxID=869962 RepID=UPI003640104A
MKALFIFCSICCFVAVLRLPISYYTFLRIVVSCGSIVLVYSMVRHENYALLILFAVILLLFNPIFPIYLHRKSVWMPLDVIVGILFLFIAFLKKEKRIEKEIEVVPRRKAYTRDYIILPKKEN